MKIATIRTVSGTAAVRVDDGALIEIGFPDVGALLRRSDWRELVAAAVGPAHELHAADFAPVIPSPGKIVCVGLNYRAHILEMGREIPTHPTLFTKYPEALIGAHDDIALAPESDAVDWEAELAIVVGSTVRRAKGQAAADAIAGFATFNDVTMRDWQYRTPMWDQGKTWESTTPFGPFLVTPDELPGGVRPELQLLGLVNDEVVQEANTADLVFDPVSLVEYISTIVTLRPGDVIATGTPGGVGHARNPARYLKDGDVLTTQFAGLGTSRNRATKEVL